MATVLAVDADECALGSLQEILEAFGHVLVPLLDDETALQIVRQREFALFLIDILNERLDPIKLTKEILVVKPGARVIGITAYPKDPRALEVLDAGAESLMRKPYEIGKLLQMLSESPS